MSDVIVDSMAALDHIRLKVLPFKVSNIKQLLHLMSPPRTVIITGVGKSFCMAGIGASLFQSVGIHATAVHATDLLHGSFGLHFEASGSTIIAISHSGETTEVINVIEHVKKHARVFDITVAVTGNRLSALGQAATIVLPYDIDADGSTHGTIPSISTTAQLAWLNILACTKADEMSATQLALSHPGGKLALKYEEEIENA